MKEMERGEKKGERGERKCERGRDGMGGTNVLCAWVSCLLTLSGPCTDDIIPIT